MKVIIIGTTGATGKPLVETLLSTNTVTKVTVFTRKKYFPQNPKLKEIVIDFNQLSEYTTEINGDVAFSCMGTTLKIAGSKEEQWKIDYSYQLEFAELAKENNIPVFGLLSAANANKNSSIFYSKMKGKLEEAIISLGFDRTIIYQPSILIRPDSDRLGEKIAATIMKGISKLGIAKNHRPTHVHDLAKAMIAGISEYDDKVKRVTVPEIHLLAGRNKK